MSMYAGWCGRNSLAIDVTSTVPNREGGTRSVECLVKGGGALALLRGEAGVHRLSRISSFGKKEKRHTSFAAVSILPTSHADVEVPESEVRFEAMCAGGPGGQHMQKNETAIRATHVPTGLTAKSQGERSQSANRKAALRVLTAKVIEARGREASEGKRKRHSELPGIQFGNQVRSYVLTPYRLISDLTTGRKTDKVDEVLSGDLSLVR